MVQVFVELLLTISKRSSTNKLCSEMCSQRINNHHLDIEILPLNELFYFFSKKHLMVRVIRSCNLNLRQYTSSIQTNSFSKLFDSLRTKRIFCVNVHGNCSGILFLDIHCKHMAELSFS